MSDRLPRIALLLVLCLPVPSQAQGLRELLDSVDLNEYSLGLNLYWSQSRYEGVDDFVVPFPAPTTFSRASISEDTFYIGGSKLGLRKFVGDGWNFGGLLDIQTLGYGSNDSEVLLGMRRRNWTLQAGAMAGKRVGPVALTAYATTDILNEHKGHEVSLNAALPFVREKWLVIPQVDFVWQSDKLVNHYFGVREAEAAPGRPAYAPGSATTISGILELSWRFHPRWYLNTSIMLDYLPDKIRNSPIVDKDTSWRFNVGVAYDRAAWTATDSADLTSLTGFDVGVGAFFASTESNVDVRGLIESRSPDLESGQGLDDRTTTTAVDLVWRAGRYHRIDFSYFSLNRDATTDIVSDLVVGDTAFAAGDSLRTEFNTRVFRLGYGFSFLRDAQKELTLFGGAHVTDVDYRVRGSTETESVSTTPVLPVIGLHLRANPTERLAIVAGLEIFQLDFDKHSGELIDFSFGGQYRVTEWLKAGAGYRFYRQDIDAGDDSFLGDYRMQYRGPFVVLRAQF